MYNIKIESEKGGTGKTASANEFEKKCAEAHEARVNGDSLFPHDRDTQSSMTGLLTNGKKNSPHLQEDENVAEIF